MKSGIKEKRAKVPSRMTDTVLFESDRTCCICNDPSRTVQIHHLDGDPNNNNFDNLAVLCLEHHNEATITSGMGRKLTEGQIKKYRDHWYEVVRSLRSNLIVKIPSNEELHLALLEALSCHEIKKINAELIEKNWKEQTLLVKSLFLYTTISYGHRVRSEILYTLKDLSERTRFGMPSDIASIIENIILQALPISSLVCESEIELTDDDKSLFSRATHIGFSMSYDALKYLSDFKVFAYGARILSIVLRFANLNKLHGIKKEAVDQFNDLINNAIELKCDDAKRWLEFEKDDALSLKEDNLPIFPEDIAKRYKL